MKRFQYLLLFTIVLGCAALVQAASPVPDQPRMQQARENLEVAKSELQNAEHNKGGHRAKAQDYVNDAIVEVDRGIEFDRRHNHAEANRFVPALTPDQPHMLAALNALNNAKRNLLAATADKGGHRAKALVLVNKALHEVADGIAAGR